MASRKAKKSSVTTKSHHRLVTEFGRNLRRIRNERGISQTALALKATIDTAHLGRIERGSSACSLDIVGRVAEALGVSTADLLKSDASWADSVEPLRNQIRESLETALRRASKPELSALAILIAGVARNQN